jgi:organic hydroperoxide reductase OsmC/OhrA
MLGTLNGALEARQVKLEPGAIEAEVEGVNELVDGLPVLREVRIHYRLRVPNEARERVDRALARHQEKCPTAATLQGRVAVSWTAEIEET